MCGREATRNTPTQAEGGTPALAIANSARVDQGEQPSLQNAGRQPVRLERRQHEEEYRKARRRGASTRSRWACGRLAGGMMRGAGGKVIVPGTEPRHGVARATCEA